MHLQGPVPLGHESYIERPFELKLIRELQAGRWVLFLGPRQHGKTSALVVCGRP
jgi:predicted AAA+ superfamily ATPase